MTEFVDIKIIDLDVSLTRQSDRAEGLRQMFLTLSQDPPSTWTEIFTNEREFPRHSMWRRAWIDGNHIVVECAPDELPRYHLSDLKQDVANTNAKYREHLQRTRAAQERQQQADTAERQNLDDLRRRLDFN